MSALPTAARWPWPPLLKASVWLHGLALLVLVLRPAAWPWLLAAVAANHMLITLTGLWPRSTWLGPNLLRLPPAAQARGEVALTLDDGPDPQVTPQVLALLAAAGARATFFCIAQRAQQHPALMRAIVLGGHSVQNHSYAHRHHFSLQGPRALGREIDAAQTVLQAATGTAPRFFRAPAGLRNPFLAAVLHQRGLQLASWTRRGFDTRSRDPQRVLARLTRALAAGDILLLHDGHGARDAKGQPIVLTVLPLLLARLRSAGLSPVTLPQALAAGSDALADAAAPVAVPAVVASTAVASTGAPAVLPTDEPAIPRTDAGTEASTAAPAIASTTAPNVAATGPLARRPSHRTEGARVLESRHGS